MSYQWFQKQGKENAPCMLQQVSGWLGHHTRCLWILDGLHLLRGKGTLGHVMVIALLLTELLVEFGCKVRRAAGEVERITEVFTATVLAMEGVVERERSGIMIHLSAQGSATSAWVVHPISAKTKPVSAIQVWGC